ncbi:hypothetical protein KR222_003927 [Zaprionus bogoriensis]|nr:hypothetical protein KR222_003927 [Zaprionus bogoriensis]
MRTNAVLSCLLLLLHNVCCDEDSWVEPHAWSEFSTESYLPGGGFPEESCQCLAPTGKSLASVEDQVALTYFKKFVNALFSSKKLQYGKTAQHFRRSLLFTLQPSQLSELEAIQDVRDLDILLTKILDQAKDLPLYAPDGSDYAYTHQGMGVRALVTDIFKDLRQLLHASEVKFMLTVLLAITTGWLVRKRYRLPVIVIILGGFFIYGYFHTYLECNRKLEADSLMEVMVNDDNSRVSEKSWFYRVFGFLSTESTETKLKQKILKSSKLNLPFCRPDHVFIMYTSDIFLKQIEMLLEKTTHSLSSLSTGLSFPYNLLAPFALVMMIGYILKLTFKYVISPKAWMGFWQRRSSAPSTGHQEAISAGDSGGDRLSGDNLKMLLNVISASNITQSQQQQTPQQLAVSGVQELLEPLEAPPEAATKSNSNSANSSKEKLNVSNTSADIAQEAGFTVVDDEES